MLRLVPVVLLFSLYSVRSAPSSSTDIPSSSPWPATASSAISNPSWDFKKESADTQTDTESDTVSDTQPAVVYGSDQVQQVVEQPQQDGEAVVVQQDTAGQPAASDTAEQPAAPDTAEQPAAPDTAEQPAAPDSAEQPAAPDSAEQPAASDSVEQPAAPDTAEQPAAPDTAEQPAAPVQTNPQIVVVPLQSEDLQQADQVQQVQQLVDGGVETAQQVVNTVVDGVQPAPEQTVPQEIQTEGGEAVQETQQLVQPQDDGLTVNQPQVVVVDPLSGSTMVTSNNQESSADQTQTETQVDSDTSQEENSVETSGNEEEEGDEGEEENEAFAFGSTLPPSSTSSSELLGSFESSLPTEKGTDIADTDNGYQVDNNYNIEQSAEQDIVEKIKEIEEAEEKEIEAAGWADAMATTQVIAFIIIAMVAVVVIYVLYIARKKSKERRKEKEYRNLLQEDYDSDDDKSARKKRYG